MGNTNTTTNIVNNYRNGSVTIGLKNESQYSVKATIPIMGCNYVGTNIKISKVGKEIIGDYLSLSCLRVKLDSEQTGFIATSNVTGGTITALKEIKGDLFPMDRLSLISQLIQNLGQDQLIARARFSQMILALYPSAMEQEINSDDLFDKMMEASKNQDLKGFISDDLMMQFYQRYGTSDHVKGIDPLAMIGKAVRAEEIISDSDIGNLTMGGVITMIYPRDVLQTIMTNSLVVNKQIYMQDYKGTLGAFEVLDYLKKPMITLIESQNSGAIDYNMNRTALVQTTSVASLTTKVQGTGEMYFGMCYNQLNWSEAWANYQGGASQYSTVNFGIRGDLNTAQNDFPTDAPRTRAAAMIPYVTGINDMPFGFDLVLKMTFRIGWTSGIPGYKPTPDSHTRLTACYTKWVEGVSTIQFETFILDNVWRGMTRASDPEDSPTNSGGALTANFTLTLRIDDSPFNFSMFPWWADQNAYPTGFSPSVASLPKCGVIFFLDIQNEYGGNRVYVSMKVVTSYFVPTNRLMTKPMLRGPCMELSLPYPFLSTQYDGNRSICSYVLRLIDIEESNYTANPAEYTEQMKMWAFRQLMVFERPDSVGYVIFILKNRMSPQLIKAAKVMYTMPTLEKVRMLTFWDKLLSSDIRHGSEYYVMNQNNKIKLVDELLIGASLMDNILMWDPLQDIESVVTWSFLTKIQIVLQLIYLIDGARTGENPIIMYNRECINTNDFADMLGRFVPLA